jgi:hypothetical protein
VIFHHYAPEGEGTGPLMRYVEEYARLFRQLPGREQGKVMITETDAWFQGWGKQQYILDRQFRFIDRSNLLLGVHHFCCMAYNESGNYTFGIIHETGGIIPGVFWPYWLFRNWIGNSAATTVTGAPADRFDIAASRLDEGGRTLATAVIHHRGTTAAPVNVTLRIPPAAAPRVLAIDHTAPDHSGPMGVYTVPPDAERLDFSLPMQPGEAFALTLRDLGPRLFPFADINNQETPWIETTADRESLTFEDTTTIRVRVLNTLATPAAGTIMLAGVPAGWRVDPPRHTPPAVAPGEWGEVTFTVTACNLTESPEVGISAVLLSPAEAADEPARLKGAAQSIPAHFDFVRPVEVLLLPTPINAVAGESNGLVVQLSSNTDAPLSGDFRLEAPAPLEAIAPTATWTLDPHDRRRWHLPLRIPAGTPPGVYTVNLHTGFLGATFTRTARVVVHPDAPRPDAIPLDLSADLNFDALTYHRNRTDYDAEPMGLFSFPADHIPGGMVVNSYGIPLRIASVEDGRRNVILPQGQRLAIPATAASAVVLVGFGHDGSHPGTWTLHYEDGTSTAVASQIPEWCMPPPAGARRLFEAPHRHMPAGNAGPACEFFQWEITADPARRLVAIELPVMEDAYLAAITVLPAR